MKITSLAYLVQVGSLLVYFSLTWFAVKFLNSEDLKVWFIFNSFIPFSNIIEFGIPTVIVRNLARMKNSEDGAKTKIISLLLPIVAIGFTVLVVCLILYSNLYRGPLKQTAVMFIFSVYLRALLNLVLAPFFAAGALVFEKSVRVIQIGIQFTLAALLVSRFGLFALVFATFCSFLLPTIIVIGLVLFKFKNQLLKSDLIGANSIVQVYREIKSDIFDAVFTSIPAYIISQMPTWIISLSGGITDIAIVSFSQQVATALIGFITIPASLVAPFCVNARRYQRLSAAKVASSNSLAITATLSTAVFLIFCPAMSYVLNLLFDGKVSFPLSANILTLTYVYLESIAVACTIPCYAYFSTRFHKVTWLSVGAFCVIGPPLSFLFKSDGVLVSLILSKIFTIYLNNCYQFIVNFGIQFKEIAVDVCIISIPIAIVACLVAVLSRIFNPDLNGSTVVLGFVFGVFYIIYTIYLRKINLNHYLISINREKFNSQDS